MPCPCVYPPLLCLPLQARYKYVPFWAPTDKVYGAMSTDYFGSTRGFAVVHVNPAGPVMPQQQEECTLKPPGGLRDTE